MRRWFTLGVMLVVLGLGVSAFAAPEGTLILANANDAITADPHVNIYNYSYLLQKGPYEGLIMVDQAGAVQPRLAERWEISEDGLVYTFYLRSGITFTDGTPFNAEAVKYNAERILALGLHGSTYLPKGMEAVVVDDLTVQLVLEEPMAPFLAALSTLLCISPTAAQEHEQDGDMGRAWLDMNAVGTGPYVLETWEKDGYYKMTYNPDYWQGWNGSHYETVIVRIIPEQATRVQLLQTGEIDAAIGIADDAFLTMLASDPSLEVTSQPTGQVVYVRFKMKGAFENPLVRQALLYVFPYTEFWREVQRGRGSSVHGFLAPAVFGSDDMLPMMHQDLTKAKELLAEAGYADGLELEMWTISSFLPLAKPMSELFKEAAAKIGVEVTLKDIASAGTYIGACGSEDVNEGPDMFAWAQAPGINSPLTAVFGMWNSANMPPGVNYTHYQNDEFDRLYAEAAVTIDDAARAAIYSEMQQVLAQDPPAIPIGTYDAYICTKVGVQGLALNLANAIIDWYAVGPATP